VNRDERVSPNTCICVPDVQYSILQGRLGGLVGKALAPSVECRWLESPVGSSQRLKNWHLLLPWLAFTIEGLEQDWLAQCRFKVTGWRIMFICDIVFRCAGK